ncbi:hypothetical protein SUDANB121_03098 [Nocardiopsis dassonvillei]|uniref:hypothetical protein n=1 Tax=Nocardiopsis dassonvillei TaxID=2014 RepID=UPI003F55EE8E
MGSAEKRLERFVRARIAEAPPGDPVARSHRALVAVLDALRREASAEEDLAWAEAATGWFDGWFDGDGHPPWSSGSELWAESAEATAAAVAARVLACMALVHAGHPDYDPAWARAAPAA